VPLVVALLLHDTVLYNVAATSPSIDNNCGGSSSDAAISTATAASIAGVRHVTHRSLCVQQLQVSLL
jgi:hypothetical protein